MMNIDIVLMIVIGICLIGGTASWWYGSQQYGKGILDGIQMHHQGRLTYKAYIEDGQEMLSINIKEEDEE